MVTRSALLADAVLELLRAMRARSHAACTPRAPPTCVIQAATSYATIACVAADRREPEATACFAGRAVCSREDQCVNRGDPALGTGVSQRGAGRTEVLCRGVQGTVALGFQARTT